MELNSDKNLKYSKFKDPFNYIVIQDFLDLDYLKKLDNYFNKVPKTLYVKEFSVASISYE